MIEDRLELVFASPQFLVGLVRLVLGLFAVGDVVEDADDAAVVGSRLANLDDAPVRPRVVVTAGPPFLVLPLARFGQDIGVARPVIAARGAEEHELAQGHADFHVAVVQVVEFLEAVIEDLDVEIAVDDHHAARHVVQGQAQLRRRLRQFPGALGDRLLEAVLVLLEFLLGGRLPGLHFVVGVHDLAQFVGAVPLNDLADVLRVHAFDGMAQPRQGPADDQAGGEQGDAHQCRDQHQEDQRIDRDVLDNVLPDQPAVHDGHQFSDGLVFLVGPVDEGFLGPELRYFRCRFDIADLAQHLVLGVVHRRSLKARKSLHVGEEGADLVGVVFPDGGHERGTLDRDDVLQYDHELGPLGEEIPDFEHRKQGEDADAHQRQVNREKFRRQRPERKRFLHSSFPFRAGDEKHRHRILSVPVSLYNLFHGSVGNHFPWGPSGFPRSPVPTSYRSCPFGRLATSIPGVWFPRRPGRITRRV